MFVYPVKFFFLELVESVGPTGQENCVSNMYANNTSTSINVLVFNFSVIS